MTNVFLGDALPRNGKLLPMIERPQQVCGVLLAHLVELVLQVLRVAAPFLVK